MTWGAAEIERIVRQVVARMQAESAVAPAAEVAGLVLESKVVSLAQLDGRLDGARQITVRRDAIITPAARDWLREKQIAVHVAEVKEPGTLWVAKTTRLVVGVAEASFDPTAVLRAAGQSVAQRVANTGLTSVVDELCDQVAKSGSLGLLFTSAHVTALCLANRQRGVRAIEAHDVRVLAEGMSAVGANMLVLNPAGIGAVAMRRLIEQFCSTVHSCPEGLRKYLG